MTISLNAEKSDGRLERAKAALAEKPDGVVEAIAAKAEVTPAEILALLPHGAAVSAPAEKFNDIWDELRSWGEVLMIVQTPDIVFEVPGHLPEGTEGHGWFNIHGDSPIGGHIKKDNCASITFIDREFHGRRSLSVWFMNAGGSAMFKLFVRRDENKELLADQLTKFEALRNSFLS
ncbi:heme utilization cystosolic carrier protein HutX [Agrobacterium bohemicum]|uniref:heme utilization cystosolic carrier protein HutX n=1 Tax=Agrobacterium bohemicum TaxID=2052828 RepID=UPI000AF4FC3B